MHHGIAQCSLTKLVAAHGVKNRRGVQQPAQHVPMRLYHETPQENVPSILRDGFGDGGTDPGSSGGTSGVFVADERPRFRSDWAVLIIEADLSDEELEAYAHNRRVWPPHGNSYREWCVPAERLNRCGRPEVLNALHGT